LAAPISFGALCVCFVLQQAGLDLARLALPYLFLLFLSTAVIEQELHRQQRINDINDIQERFPQVKALLAKGWKQGEKPST
jgi:hypothetical protein